MRAPFVEVFGPEEASAADERAALVEVIEHGGSHATVAGGRGEVVDIRPEDAVEAAVFPARVEGKEVAFALKARDVGVLAEQSLVSGVEEPRGATHGFEGPVGKVLGEKLSGLAQGIAAGFKAHGAVFGDVDFEDGIALGEDAIPFGAGEANGSALGMAVGVNGVADDVG